MSEIDIFVDREPRPMLFIIIERDPLTGTAIRKTVGVGEVCGVWRGRVGNK